MIAAMDKVGVDGAIFISAFSMYRYDASYAVEVNGPIPNGSSSSRCLGQRIQPLDDQVSFAQQSTIFALITRNTPGIAMFAGTNASTSHKARLRKAVTSSSVVRPG
jgi:hypothetical protein